MQESVQALHANRLRSLLTIIGIVVGIFSVTAMLALGAGLSQNIVGRISSFSQGDISVSGPLSSQDFTWVKERPYIKTAIASVSIQATNLIAFNESFTVSSKSVLGDLNGVQPFALVSGTPYDFTDPLFGEKVLIVTSDLEDAVVKKTGRSLLGQDVTLNGQLYNVVAIIKVGTAGFSRGDGTVYIPYRTAIASLTSTTNFSSIGVTLKDSTDFEIAGKNILEGLNASRDLTRDDTDVFTVSSAQSIIESVRSTVSMISLFLGIVGGIALFVGGIGTMNMMLTTVTERTKEIGLRKAIGARRKDILLQILCESVFLTTLGGAVGIFLTWVLALVANSILTSSSVISVVVSPQVVMIATAVSASVGIVFGLYPANNASNLQPVDALRSE